MHRRVEASASVRDQPPPMRRQRYAVAAWLFLGAASRWGTLATNAFGTDDAAAELIVPTLTALQSTPDRDNTPPSSLRSPLPVTASAGLNHLSRVFRRERTPPTGFFSAPRSDRAASRNAAGDAGTCRARWQGEPPPPVPPEFQAPPFPAGQGPFATDMVERGAFESFARTTPTWVLTETRLAKLHNATNGQCHLVFSINSGRSGSNYMAEMAETLGGVRSTIGE